MGERFKTERFPEMERMDYETVSALVDDDRSGWSFATTQTFASFEAAQQFLIGRPDKDLYDRYAFVEHLGKGYLARHAGGKLSSSRRVTAA
jgi:hypothetical protein